MEDNTEIMGARSGEPLPFRCHRVNWLAEILDMPRQQAYSALANEKIPPECIVRIGRSIRFKEKETLEWILSGGTR